MASRPRSILRNNCLRPSLDYKFMAVGFSLPSESLLTPPSSSPEAFDTPSVVFQSLPSANDITPAEHAECEWCLGLNICIRTEDNETVDEGRVAFWSTLRGSRATSSVAADHVFSNDLKFSNPDLELSDKLVEVGMRKGEKKKDLKKIERNEGEEFKRKHRIERTRQEDKESEERRKYIWRIQEELGAWEEEKRLQMEDVMPLRERREKREEEEKNETSPARGSD